MEIEVQTETTDGKLVRVTAERDALRTQLQTAREALLRIDGETIDHVVVGIARQALAAIKKETQP